VARRVGVSHAAPAHHFGDKAGLLTAIAAEGFHRFIDHMATAVASPAANPRAMLIGLGRAYAEFAESQPGYFDVMFRPALIHTEDPDYLEASDAAFAALLAVVEMCQRAGWNTGGDSRAIAAATWSFAHGITVLRQYGSLQRHFPDPTLDAVTTIASTLLAGAELPETTTPSRVR
jgi:AcrR family transcriptional regulator